MPEPGRSAPCPAGATRKITAHRHTIPIPLGREIPGRDILGHEVPAAKDPYPEAGAGRRVDLLALHGAEELLAGVLPRPHCHETGGGLLRSHDPQVRILCRNNLTIVPVGRRLCVRILAEVVLLTCSGNPGMDVARADETEFVRVRPELLSAARDPA